MCVDKNQAHFVIVLHYHHLVSQLGVDALPQTELCD